MEKGIRWASLSCTNPSTDDLLYVHFGNFLTDQIAFYVELRSWHTFASGLEVMEESSATTISCQTLTVYQFSWKSLELERYILGWNNIWNLVVNFFHFGYSCYSIPQKIGVNVVCLLSAMLSWGGLKLRSHLGDLFLKIFLMNMYWVIGSCVLYWSWLKSVISINSFVKYIFANLFFKYWFCRNLEIWRD